LASAVPRPVSPLHDTNSIRQVGLANGTLNGVDDDLLEDPGGEGEIICQECDVEPLKIATNPGQPTAEELENHRCDHQPYRSWCKWCVMGRGLGQQHKSKAPGSTIPRVGIDYFYLTKGGAKGILARNELSEAGFDSSDKIHDARDKGELVKCLLVRCWETKNVFAHVIPVKGADEEGYAAKLGAADMRWLGHTRLIVKCDNEASLVALKDQILNELKMDKDLEQASDENPARYESQSNGGTEVGVRNVRGLMRTLKLCLESRIGKYIPVTHAIIPWLLEHTCLLINARVKGPDGLTPWSRVRGRAFNQRLLCFGEKILYKLPSKGPMHDPDGNIGTRWLEAVFLG